MIQTCAFVSLLTGACVPTHVAMTGEVCALFLKNTDLGMVLLKLHFGRSRYGAGSLLSAVSRRR
jgi:hypothetical protein